MAGEKRPFVAAVLSLFVAGAGQLYLGRYLRALLFFSLDLLTASLLAYDELLAFALNLAVSLAASFDAYHLARSKIRAEKPVEEEVKVVFTR